MAESLPQQPLVINSQYIKDLSFENPNAPGVYASLSARAPELTVGLDVKSVHLSNRSYEVVLSIRVEASVENRTAFLVELDYAALVTIGASVPTEKMEPLLLVEGPRQIFPFARSMLAAVTRDGGFPPVVINPIDFEQYYRRHKQGKEATAAAPAPAGAAEA